MVLLTDESSLKALKIDLIYAGRRCVISRNIWDSWNEF